MKNRLYFDRILDFIYFIRLNIQEKHFHNICKLAQVEIESGELEY